MLCLMLIISSCVSKGDMGHGNFPYYKNIKVYTKLSKSSLLLKPRFVTMRVLLLCLSWLLLIKHAFPFNMLVLFLFTWIPISFLYFSENPKSTIQSSNWGSSNYSILEFLDNRILFGFMSPCTQPISWRSLRILIYRYHNYIVLHIGSRCWTQQV